jgi:hypothetical protein
MLKNRRYLRADSFSGSEKVSRELGIAISGVAGEFQGGLTKAATQ